MKQYYTPGVRVFTVFNYLFIGIVAFSCLLPFINLTAVSFSSSIGVSSGHVGLWPVDFSLDSYKIIIKNSAFWRSAWISIERTVIGVPLTLILTILAAYPLSKEKSEFKMRGFYVWFFMITMLVGGGLIPFYMVISTLQLVDSIWVLVLPGAFSTWNAILMLNFMRGLPKELMEAAAIDGADQLTIMWRIVVPLLKPSIATITLFSIVGHWNSWFDGLIFMNRPDNYPLQSYLQTLVINPQSFMKQIVSAQGLDELLRNVNNKTVKDAQLVIATVPIVLVYPFLQKYFTKGLVLGSVKG